MLRLQDDKGPPMKLRLVFDLLSGLACILTAAAQLVWFDIWLSQRNLPKEWLVCLAIGDCIVLAVMLVLQAVQSYNNYKWLLAQQKKKRKKLRDNVVQYAFAVWLIYGLLLGLKVIATFYSSVHVDEHNEHGYRLIISMAALVYLLLLFSHHRTHLDSPRQEYVSLIVFEIAIDIVDSAQLLDFLIEQGKEKVNAGIKGAIVFLVCLNLLYPTLGLLEMRLRLPAGYTKPLLIFVSLIILNLPYLGIRIYFGAGIVKLGVEGPLMIKNLVMICLGVRELWLHYLRVIVYGDKEEEDESSSSDGSDHHDDSEKQVTEQWKSVIFRTYLKAHHHHDDGPTSSSIRLKRLQSDQSPTRRQQQQPINSDDRTASF